MSLRRELLSERGIIFEWHYTCNMTQLTHKRNLDLTKGQSTSELFSLSGIWNELSEEIEVRFHIFYQAIIGAKNIIY